MIEVNEESVSSRETSHSLFNSFIDPGEQKLSTRCQRIIENFNRYDQPHLKRLKRSFEHDLLLSKAIVLISVMFLFQKLIAYLMGWSISDQRYLQLMLINSTLFLLPMIAQLIKVRRHHFRQSLLNVISQHLTDIHPTIFFNLLAWQMKYGLRFEEQSDVALIIAFVLSFLAFFFSFAMTIFLFSYVCRKYVSEEMFPKVNLIALYGWFYILFTLWYLWITRHSFISQENRETTDYLVITLFHFVFLSQLSGFVCATIGMLFATQRKAFFNFQFLYYQAYYAELTKLYIIIFYTPASIMLTLSVTLLQSLVYWRLKMQFRPYIFLLKECNYSLRSTISQSRSNQFYTNEATKTFPFSPNQPQINKTIRLLSQQNSEFCDQNCCMCLNQLINIVFLPCYHACLCSDCLQKQLQKQMNIYFEQRGLKCPLCCCLVEQVLAVDYCSKGLPQEVLRRNWQGLSVYVQHYYIKL